MKHLGGIHIWNQWHTPLEPGPNIPFRGRQELRAIFHRRLPEFEFSQVSLDLTPVPSSCPRTDAWYSTEVQNCILGSFSGKTFKISNITPGGPILIFHSLFPLIRNSKQTLAPQTTTRRHPMEDETIRMWILGKELVSFNTQETNLV